MRKNKVVELSASDRARLEKFSGSGQALAPHLKHAQVLLKLAEGWQNQQVAQAFDLCEKTVIAIRHRFLRKGWRPSSKTKRAVVHPSALTVMLKPLPLL